MKTYRIILLSFIFLNIISCRYGQVDVDTKSPCLNIGSIYPANITLPAISLPTPTQRVYISINNEQIEYDSCVPGLAPRYYESPVSIKRKPSGDVVSVSFEPWEATAYLDEDNYPLENPGIIRAEVYLSSGCAEEPTLYKYIETNQFAWWPIYINGGSNCGADMQKALAIGAWE